MSELFDKMYANEFNSLFDEFLVFYTEIKVKIIKCDTQDKNKSVSLVAVNELRNAFDHLYRAQIVFRNLTDRVKQLLPAYEEPHDKPGYCKKHLEKAWAHLYRAGYDACDLICINLLTDVEVEWVSISREYKTEVINATMPEFFSDIYDKIVAAKQESVISRSLKDIDSQKSVVSKEEEKDRFHKYEDIVNDLESIQNLLRSKRPNLAAYAKKHGQEERTKTIKHILLGILITMIGGIIVKSAISYYDKSQLPSQQNTRAGAVLPPSTTP